MMDTIISIEPYNTESSRYDLQVEDNSNLYANDILVHNCTIYYKNGKSGICSRNFEKPITYKKKTGFKKGLFYKFLSYFGYDRNIYSIVESESEFVKVGKPYLEKLVEYCELNKLNLALRGELIGGLC